LPSAPLMLGRYHSPMAREKAVSIPPCCKHRFVHRPPTRLVPFPYLVIVDSLPGLVRAQKQARDIATHVLKTFPPPASFPIGQEPPLNLLRHPHYRKHSLPLLYIWRGFSLSSPFLLCHSLTFQVVLYM